MDSMASADVRDATRRDATRRYAGGTAFVLGAVPVMPGTAAARPRAKVIDRVTHAGVISADTEACGIAVREGRPDGGTPHLRMGKRDLTGGSSASTGSTTPA